MDSSNARFITYMFTDLFGFCYFVLPVVLAFAAQLLLCFRAKHIPPKLLSPGMVLLILAAVYGRVPGLWREPAVSVPSGYRGPDSAGQSERLAGVCRCAHVPPTDKKDTSLLRRLFLYQKLRQTLPG